MKDALQRYLVPGLVIQSVIVGATYSTGREVTEFFLKNGPFPALVGLFIAILLYSTCCTLAFDLSRRYRIFDYKSFCQIYLGRFWFLYEVGFLYGVMMTLSVIGAAVAEFSDDMFGAPKLLSSSLFMVLIAGLVILRTTWLERVMSIWSIYFYGIYAVLLVTAISQFDTKLSEKLVIEPVGIDTFYSAFIYTAFSCAILPTLMFVARHFRSRNDAIIAGSLCGPLVLLPGIALLLMLIPFYPNVVDEPLPILLVLDQIGVPILKPMVQVAILGTLAATGAGLLHGINERIAKSFRDSKKEMPRALRPSLALAAMVFSIFLATEVGIIELVAKGFEYGAFLFLTVMILPLFYYGGRSIFRKLSSQSVRDAAALETSDS